MEASAVRELAKEDYSWEALRKASDNWLEPVIVRGMFADTAAVKTWPTSASGAEESEELSNGLASLSKFDVSVVQNSTVGKDHWINCGGVSRSLLLNICYMQDTLKMMITRSNSYAK